MLVDFKCQLVVADTPTKAIKLTEQQFFDLILLDLELPDRDGFAVARAIRDSESNHWQKRLCTFLLRNYQKR